MELEKTPHCTDTEQSCDDELTNEDVARTFILGKGKRNWSVYRPSPAVHNERKNTVIYLSGVKAVAETAISISDCWKLFFFQMQ